MQHTNELNPSLKSLTQKLMNGHIRNLSQTIDAKDYSTQNVGASTPIKDSKQHLQGETKLLFDAPQHKKNAFSYDAKQKPASSASNLRNIVSTSIGQGQLSKQQQTATTNIATPPSVSLKSSHYNYGLSTPNRSLIAIQSDHINSAIINTQNLSVMHVKEQESMLHIPFEENKNIKMKKIPPLSSILASSKNPAEIPRSTLNFNIDQYKKKPVPQISSKPANLNSVAFLIQKQGQDQQIQQQGLAKTEQKDHHPKAQLQSANYYYQKSSYLPHHHHHQQLQQQSLTLSTQHQNTQSQSNNNIYNKTNLSSSNQTHQLPIDLGYLHGAILTESQHPQTANATFQQATYSEASSITNISNIIQPDNSTQIITAKTDDQFQFFKQIKPQQIKEEIYKKQERSLSKDQQNGIKDELSPLKLSNKKTSQNSSRNNSANKFQKSSIQINLSLINQQNSTKKTTPKKEQLKQSSPFSYQQNHFETSKTIQNLQSYEEPKKHSANLSLTNNPNITNSINLSSNNYLGIKNTNINLASLSSSTTCLTNTQQPPLNVINNQQMSNSNCNKAYENGQSIPTQNPVNNISQFRKDSLIGFQMPRMQQTTANNSQGTIKQLSKQSSSVLFADADESNIINGVKRNQQKSQTSIPVPSSSPRRNQNLFQQYKKNGDLNSPSRSQQGSPNKSLFQLVRIGMSANDGSSPSISNQNSPLHRSRSKKGRQSIILNDSRDVIGKERSVNVKTFLRFRPNNKMEIDLTNQGMGQNIIQFIDDYSVSILGDSLNVYTVDRVYRQNDEQEIIYQQVGKEVIEDVFQGYNGTIFTYGVTGSGKTHTMFGNLNDPIQKGIIPRISDQIFDLVQNDEDGTEFIINCSMLEIYKEILYDSFQEEKQELKIKENTQKGIYVQGLTQTSIATQDQLIQLITFGYNIKRTRETRLNEYSSRSHTIFTIEILQRLLNGDEKVGKINLIDLAGAEKVSRSGAQGESLEEAIKINLSLSSLGKVIHSLTNGNEYIPYRDSKLTRILQESLGGNYKTSLIVTCSMHSSFQDDTISSIKFATRAKTIKNTFKMNIKFNPQNLQKEVESLRMLTENYKHIMQNVKNIFSETQNKISCLPNSSTDPKLFEIKSKLEEFLTISNMMDDISGKSSQEIYIPGSYDSRQFVANMLTTKKDAIMIVKDDKIKQLEQINADSSEKIDNQQQEIQELKRANLNLTTKVNELSQEKNQLKLKLSKQVSQNNYSTFSVQILQKQIQHLVDSVCRAEKKVSTTLQEKKNIIDKKFEDYLKENLNFSEIKLANYFKNSINFNFESAEKGYNDVQQTIKKFNLEGDDDFMGEKSMEIENSSIFEATETLLESNNISKRPRLSSSLANNSFAYNIDTKVFQNENNNILKQIFEMPAKLDMISASDTVSTDFVIISLKRQLIDTHILNQNLLRTVNALEWKQIIEYGKSKLKSDQIHLQKKHIKQLEHVLDDVTENHKELRLKIEDLEFDMYQQAHTKHIQTNIYDKSKNTVKNKIIIPLTHQNAIRSSLLKPDSKKSNFFDTNCQKSGTFSRLSFTEKASLQRDKLIDLQTSLNQLGLDIVPLTYDNALEELKKRNFILKKLAELNLLDQDSYYEAPQKETDEFIKNERERLNNKIVILQQELKMEQVKVESFKQSLLVERKNMKDMKQLNEEMEVSLRNNLKEENECWQKTINEITEQNKIELTKRQSEYNQLREIFYNILEISLQKISELKYRWASHELQELESIIQEMDKAKQQIGKSYENSIKKRQRNSSSHSMAILTPKKPTSAVTDLSHQKIFQFQQ